MVRDWHWRFGDVKMVLFQVVAHVSAMPAEYHSHYPLAYLWDQTRMSD